MINTSSLLFGSFTVTALLDALVSPNLWLISHQICIGTAVSLYQEGWSELHPQHLSFAETWCIHFCHQEHFGHSAAKALEKLPTRLTSVKDSVPVNICGREAWWVWPHPKSDVVMADSRPVLGSFQPGFPFYISFPPYRSSWNLESRKNFVDRDSTLF